MLTLLAGLTWFLAAFCAFLAAMFYRMSKRARIDYVSFNSCTEAFETLIFVALMMTLMAVVATARIVWSTPGETHGEEKIIFEENATQAPSGAQPEFVPLHSMRRGPA
jgi:hypothetical protein